ncbi:MAG TPA: oxygenase MpaB family protein [Solirubrobacteraceae bacterium]|nr:oxygenase MpaB family protein [Solirubrobacteraceae bacterium]
MEYFDDDSMIRRVHREKVVFLYGRRALLMQAAHPLAFAGLMAHTGSMDAPYERLARTARVIDAVTFGPRDEADRLTRRVRAMHRRVRGVLPEQAGRFPAGTPYAADDPDLLLWVLATLADSGLVVYDRYVGGLSRSERDAYWRDYRQVGRLFGLKATEMPDSLEDYIDGMLAGPDLEVTDVARDLAVRIVLHPPVPFPARPILELANFVTIGLLPARLRREYGLRWDPARTLALAGGAEYAKRLVVPLLPARLRYAG